MERRAIVSTGVGELVGFERLDSGGGISGYMVRRQIGGKRS